MMERLKQMASVCIFGSTARSTGDCISDRDLLVVADKPGELHPEIAQLTSNGWSVAVHSRRRLRKMSDAGSLFIQHLKREGKILEDHGGWLGSLLSSSQPKENYRTDITASLELLRPIERLVQTEDIPLLACDLLYVYARNVLINSFANNGSFVFDFDRLVTECSPHISISTKTRRILLQLRPLKHRYRSMAGHTGTGADIKTIDILDAISELDPTVTICPIDRDHPVRKLGSQYGTLRDCEAFIVGNGLISIAQRSGSGPLHEAWEMIQKPREYSWKVKRIRQSWIEKLNRAAFSELPQVSNRALSTMRPCMSFDTIS